jgi:hypothetical protein
MFCALENIDNKRCPETNRTARPASISIENLTKQTIAILPSVF